MELETPTVIEPTTVEKSFSQGLFFQTHEIQVQNSWSLKGWLLLLNCFNQENVLLSPSKTVEQHNFDASFIRTNTKLLPTDFN